MTASRGPERGSSRAMRAQLLLGAAGLALVLCWSAGLAAQPQAAQAQPPQAPPGGVALTVAAEPSDQPFTLTFANRPIVVFRARVLGRQPVEKVLRIVGHPCIPPKTASGGRRSPRCAPHCAALPIKGKRTAERELQIANLELQISI